MPPKRDSAAAVDDFITAFKDERVLDAIGALFDSRMETVITKLSELKDENEKLRVDLKACSDKLTDVTISLTQRVEQLETSLDNLEKKFDESAPPVSDEVEKKLEALNREAKEARLAANDAEQYGRRQNLRIRGLSVGVNDDCRLVAADFCRNSLQLPDFNASKIDVAHIIPIRAEHVTQARKSIKSEVIVKFHNREDRNSVIRNRRNLRGTAITVVEDLTSLNVQTLNRIRQDDRVATCWTWNGRIFALLKSGQKLLIRPFQALQDCQVL